jgi:hypothetical protein
MNKILEKAKATECKDCKFATPNTKRVDGLDRELVCQKLGDILGLWFAPQVPNYFSCNGFAPKETPND